MSLLICLEKRVVHLPLHTVPDQHCALHSCLCFGNSRLIPLPRIPSEASSIFHLLFFLLILIAYIFVFPIYVCFLYFQLCHSSSHLIDTPEESGSFPVSDIYYHAAYSILLSHNSYICKWEIKIHFLLHVDL